MTKAIFFASAFADTPPALAMYFDCFRFFEAERHGRFSRVTSPDYSNDAFDEKVFFPSPSFTIG